MATLKVFEENGCKVIGQIPVIFRLVSSIPEVKECQIRFKESDAKRLLKEGERYRIQNTGKTPNHEVINRLIDGEDRWEIEYEVTHETFCGDKICCVRKVFYKCELIYKVADTCKRNMYLEF